MIRRTTPSTILMASAPREGAVLCFGGEFPVARTVTATTIPSDADHPKTNAAPILVPRSDARITMKAVSATGHKVIAEPIIVRSRIICSGLDERTRFSAAYVGKWAPTLRALSPSLWSGTFRRAGDTEDQQELSSTAESHGTTLRAAATASASVGNSLPEK
jgi:hypothetical protein